MESTQLAGLRYRATQKHGQAKSHFSDLAATCASSRPAHGGPEAGELPCRSTNGTTCKFDIYRADEVRMTSTQFGGGDWHWRLSDGHGEVLLDTGGYASEHQCRRAISILQENAGWASVALAS